MKIAICVSNNEILIKNSILYMLNRKLFKKNYDWSDKFIGFLENLDIKHEVVDMDCSNWIENVEKVDLIIWKPEFMGVRSSQIIKEKVYFMQHIMKKRVFPNYETIWHFDSKISQSYLFQYKKIKTPKTFSSFNYNEAINKANNSEYPIVVKESNGAGSSGVKLIKSHRQMVKYINKRFLWENIFARKISSRLFDRFGQIYLQEFLPSNDSDLRITVIGCKFAFGFWRKNRDDDFRASGSGKLDYKTSIPTEIIEYCCKISADNNFDSMAYDILFKDGDYHIIEMSYGYNETAIYKCEGFYLLDDNCEVSTFKLGHYWPQELWMKWIMNNEDSIL